MISRHIFLSPNGDMLPRWREAFPEAEQAAPDGAPAAGENALAWLRLAGGLPVAEQIAALRRRLGDVPFVVLSDIPNDAEALAAFSAAARGYCNSHAVPAVLRQIADVVRQGGIWIGEGMMQRLFDLVGALAAPAQSTVGDWKATLSEREQEVALAIADGRNNKEIAGLLGITERTVKAHVGTILNKLQVRDRLQLALVIQGLHQRS